MYLLALSNYLQKSNDQLCDNLENHSLNGIYDHPIKRFRPSNLAL
jgi:hypothetical protein